MVATSTQVARPAATAPIMRIICPNAISGSLRRVGARDADEGAALLGRTERAVAYHQAARSLEGEIDRVGRLVDGGDGRPGALRARAGLQGDEACRRELDLAAIGAIAAELLAKVLSQLRLARAPHAE